jgi:hypothetical protein
VFQKAKSNLDILRTSWRDEDRSNHFIYHLVKDINEMSARPSAEARKFFLDKIKRAQQLYAEMEKGRVQLHEYSRGDFLKVWEESFG